MKKFTLLLITMIAILTMLVGTSSKLYGASSGVSYSSADDDAQSLYTLILISNYTYGTAYVEHSAGSALSNLGGSTPYQAIVNSSAITSNDGIATAEAHADVGDGSSGEASADANAIATAGDSKANTSANAQVGDGGAGDADADASNSADNGGFSHTGATAISAGAGDADADASSSIDNSSFNYTKAQAISTSSGDANASASSSTDNSELSHTIAVAGSYGAGDASANSTTDAQGGKAFSNASAQARNDSASASAIAIAGPDSTATSTSISNAYEDVQVSDSDMDFDIGWGGIAFAYAETDAKVGEITTFTLAISFSPDTTAEVIAEANEDGVVTVEANVSSDASLLNNSFRHHSGG